MERKIGREKIEGEVKRGFQVEEEEAERVGVLPRLGG